jgi:quinol-cytochrome oxidoreductase complex cytochrome b subunit
MALTNLLGTLGGFFSDAFTTSVPMLPRLYSLHVSIVPLILALLLIAHFFLVKRHGISPPRRRRMPAWRRAGGCRRTKRPTSTRHTCG